MEMSTSAMMASPTASRISSLVAKWLYSDGARTSSSVASRRVESASSPSASMIVVATSTMRVRVSSGWRGRTMATFVLTAAQGHGYREKLTPVV